MGPKTCETCLRYKATGRTGRCSMVLSLVVSPDDTCGHWLDAKRRVYRIADLVDGAIVFQADRKN